MANPVANLLKLDVTQSSPTIVMLDIVVSINLLLAVRAKSEYIETLTESVELSEVIAPTTSFSVTQTEAIECSDSIDDLSPTMEESTAISDSYAAKSTFSASQSEEVALRITDMATANKVISLYLYSKGKQTERHLYAQMSDGDVIEASSIPPTVTTGAFGSEVFNGTSTDQIPASWSTYNDYLIYSNGSDQHQIYPGEDEKVRQFIVYHGADATPSIVGDFGVDFTNNVTDGDSTTVAILDSIGTGAGNYGRLFIRTPIPATSLTFTVTKPNGSASVASMYYFNGTWTGVTGLSDGTASSGCSIGQSGSMTWTKPTDEMSLYSFGNVGFWYYIEFSAALDSEVEVSEVRFSSGWNSIHNMWDGVPLSASETWLYNNADSAWLNYGSSAIDVGGLTSSDKFVVVSPEKLIGIYIDVGETPNTNGGTLTVKYHCTDIVGTVAKSVTHLNDSTSGLTKSGWVMFDSQSDITEEQFQNSGYYNYVYEITTDNTFSDDVIINVELMPYYEVDDLGDGVCSCQWKNRMVYTFSKYPQDMYICSEGNQMVFNGADSDVRRTGDGRANKIVAMKPFYNELLVFQEERGSQGGCITLWDGYSPATFGKLVMSTKLGTFSQKSACVIEGLFQNAEGTQTEKLICYFLSRNGVFATDGKTIVCISDDVKPYFDPTSSSCIRAGYEQECWLDYDVTYRVLRIGLVTGSSATVPNTFLWYDPFGANPKRWGTDDLTYPLSCHAQIEAGSGQYPYLQIGGGCADGFVYLLNYGTNDAGSAIDGYVNMELDYHGYVIHAREMVFRCKTQSAGNIIITPYANGVAKTSRNAAMTAAVTSETTRRHRITDINTEGNHLMIQLRNATIDQQMYLLDCGYDLVAYEHK